MRLFTDKKMEVRFQEFEKIDNPDFDDLLFKQYYTIDGAKKMISTTVSRMSVEVFDCKEPTQSDLVNRVLVYTETKRGRKYLRSL